MRCPVCLLRTNGEDVSRSPLCTGRNAWEKFIPEGTMVITARWSCPACGATWETETECKRVGRVKS